MNIRELDNLTWTELTRLHQLWCCTNILSDPDAYPPCELRALATGDDVDLVTREAAGRVLEHMMEVEAV